MGRCPQFTRGGHVRGFVTVISWVSAPLAVWSAALSLAVGKKTRQAERSLAVFTL